MIGIFLEKKLSIRTDLHIPNQQENKVLIKVRIVGISATDLEMVRGYYPFCGILGHEFVGEVKSAPG